MEEKNDNNKKVKLLCSYGGKIQSQPTSYQLSYVGGETKILAIDRAAKLSEILAKLNSLTKSDNGGEICVKYQLPGEDLDSLVSLIDDEDVEHMMVEYDRMQWISAKPPRLRIFVFNISVPPAKPASAANPDYLFGFDEEYQPKTFGPQLNLLQIPGMIRPTPENGYCCCNNVSVKGWAIPAANEAVNQTAPMYKVVVSPEGMKRVYQTGTVGYGNWEPPVYNVVLSPRAPEQTTMFRPRDF